jgi:flagellar assembly protein FliH
MPVIKADQPRPSVTTFSMADIEKQAKLVLLGAKVRAEQLLVAAQEEAEALKRTAHAQALAEGKKEGHAQGLQQGQKQGKDQALAEHRANLTTLAAALGLAAQELDAARLELDAQAKKAVIQLALAIAAKVTKRQGEQDPAVARANVEEALRLVIHANDVKIAVHPTQKDYLAQSLPEIQAKWPNLKHVALIADGTVSPGGARIFSQAGQIDADLDLQLQKIAEELLPNSPGGH